MKARTKHGKPERPHSLRNINPLFLLLFLLMQGSAWHELPPRPRSKDTGYLAQNSPRISHQGLALLWPGSCLPLELPCCGAGPGVTSALSWFHSAALPLSGRGTRWQGDGQHVDVACTAIVHLLSLQIRTIHFKWFSAKSTGLCFSRRSRDLSGISECVYTDFYPLS